MGDITVIIPTYNRPEILHQAVRGLLDNLRYDLGQIKILIGNDGELFGVPTDLFNYNHVGVIRGPHRGLGANLNKLIKTAETELVFQMDDDHILQQPLDLTPHARALLGDEDMKDGWIRLMYGHSSERTEWPRDYYRFRAKLYKYYWRLQPGHELWVPTNRPHLKSKRFHKWYGHYSEEAKLGETEYEFCMRWRRKAEESPSYPGVFIPFWPPHEDTWAHVGESWQHTEHDR